MTDQTWFGIAVVLLLAALGLGFLRWGRTAGGEGGGIVGFTLISTAIGGLLGAPFWWLDLPPSFAWDLPPIASRMLAAAALAFGVAGVMTLEHPTASRTRLYLIQIAIYIIPLALAAVALHLDRFDFTVPVTYGFFAVVLVLSIGSIIGLTRGVDQSQQSARPSRAAVVWMSVAGTILGVWGLALFAMPTSPYPLIFNWPQDPLSSRLIAAMLFTIGVSFLLSRRDLPRTRLSLVFAGAYGIGVVAACGMAALTAKPVPPLYAVGFALLAVVSLALFAGAASGSRVAAKSSP